MTLPASLSGLGAYRQFLLWTVLPNPGKPKPKKVSVNPRTKEAWDAHDPAIWMGADEAIAVAAASGAAFGIGFVLTDADPFFFVDLDDHLQPNGQWSELAQQVCAWFPGACIEISHSGKGLHIIGTGTPPPHDCKAAAHGVELYHTKRLIALTGWGATGSVASVHTAALAHLVATVPGLAPTIAVNSGSFEEPRGDWCGPEDDADLIRRALQSTSVRKAFGNHASFADLWERNVAVLASSYPSNSQAEFDESAADLALAQHLAFWTGCHAPRIERLMRQSNLMRPKWDSRSSYLRNPTIENACAQQREVLHDKQPESPVSLVATQGAGSTAVPTRTEGTAFVSIEQQIGLFAGCVYVASLNRALIPGGLLQRPESFKVMFGGFVFNLDATNTRVTRDAWEAFTQSPALRCPKVQTTVFRPREAPGSVIVLRDGTTAVNTWWPVRVPRTQGDPSRFLAHLARLLPERSDQEALLAYLAACVQYQGIKFQWAPLIQGVEGNGKSILSRCVAEAVGQRYAHWPKASKLTAQFNGWMEGKTLYCVEDIYTPGNRDEVFEELKPMITGDCLEIERKTVDQVTNEIVGNFILNSNHQAGIRKTSADRRIAPFFCAQQIRADMDDRYLLDVQDLHDWLAGQNRYTGQTPGYAVVTDYLYACPIPDHLNPARGHRAPDTTSTATAIQVSMGPAEQYVIDAIESGQPGFCGGWVSSIALGKLLESVRRPIPLNARRRMMQDLGYDWHPHLIGGRTNCVVMPDAGRPKLFVRNGHPMLALTTASEISRCYAVAQQPKLA